ncbi:MAG TPA: chromosome segregation protein SMC, partial [Candidatus Binatia bacterium]|nr:chromosome segregation protein SMC [Candidatus Binatia bacterium]
NVVIGPNGSGKSNILDALCFVLGKTSAKSMRAEKTSNLIYNGGKTKNPAKQAEVSIVFDNRKQVFPTPEDEVKVSRIVRADGQSKYKINGKTRTRQEILDLLNLAKIDPDGYNIILQGDIVHFCEMPSVERRQIVEEIAGIGVYEDKKNHALNDLAKVEENLSQVGIILKERESYLKDLKKDRDHAMKFKELNDRLRQNKATMLKRQLDTKNRDVTSVVEKVSSYRAKFDKLQGQVKATRDTIQGKRGEMSQIDQEVQLKGEQEQVAMQKDIEQLRIDIATGKTKLGASHTELGRIGQRREQLSQSLEELNGKVKESRAQKEDLDGRKVSLQKELAAHEQKLAAFKKKHQLGEESTIDHDMLTLDQHAEEKQKKLSQLREEQQNLLREKDKIEFQLQTIDQQIEKVQELEKEHTSEIKALKQKKDEFKKAVLELNQLLNGDSRMAAELAQSKQRLLKLSEELARLEVRNASVQEAVSGNVAVKKVLENRQQLGDIYGTVAELGNTSKEYSFALEIAATNRINSIVVEDDKVAAKCIKYLKENRFGTATFLPLNKIKGNPVRPENKELTKEKGVIGFAIDLIKFEPRFKEVFSYVFGNTLVVQNIEIARKIGIGKIKMVTLDGDSADVSGAMVGGYHAKKQGAFKEQELSSSIEDIQAQVAKLQHSVSKLQADKTENEEKIYKLREFKANVEGDIIKTEKSLHLDTSDMEASRSYKDELKKHLAEASKKLDAITDTISEATSELAQLKIKKQQLHDKIAELRKPTVIAELNAYEEHRKKLSDQIILITADVKNLDAQLSEHLVRDQENTKKVLKDLEQESEQSKADAKTLETTVKEQEKSLKQKEKAQSEFQSKFKDLFTRRNKLSDEITALENKAFTVEENSRKEELQMNTLSIEEARLKAEQAAMVAEFAPYEGVELTDKPDDVLAKEIKEAEKMRENIGSVNMRALEIYDTVEKEYQTLTQKKDVLVKEKEDVVNLMNEIEGKKRELFIQTLAVVKQNFVSIFNALSTKGEADLELETPENPFEGGLNIKVRLTGNKFLDIRSLSGGEKTMTALAFIFAIQEHAPASFYILDEVDAALDKHNSEKLSKLIKQYCARAQYIVISHNDNVIGEASTLYGVSLGDHGISNIVSLKI